MECHVPCMHISLLRQMGNIALKTVCFQCCNGLMASTVHRMPRMRLARKMKIMVIIRRKKTRKLSKPLVVKTVVRTRTVPLTPSLVLMAPQKLPQKLPQLMVQGLTAQMTDADVVQTTRPVMLDTSQFGIQIVNMAVIRRKMIFAFTANVISVSQQVTACLKHQFVGDR